MSRVVLVLDSKARREQASKHCGVCGALFSKSPKWSGRQWAARVYCGQTCTGRALSQQYAAARPALRDKFEALFDQPKDGCWNWRGTIEGYGYGVIDHNRKRYRAHVLALEFDGRPVPRGMVARHHCDNPRCVRPDHLCVGTVKENAIDAKERGRLKVGEDHPHARLTERAVRAMREAYSEIQNYAEVARMFGVSRPTATRIVKGTSWEHVR